MTDVLWLGLATMGAALASFFGNRVLYRFFGKGAALFAVPWWEEGCKATAIALLPGAQMLFIHILFGVFEFAYDFAGSGRKGALVGFLALWGHLMTGGVATLAVAYGGNLFWAYVIAGMTHWLFHAMILRIALPTRGADVFAITDER